MADGEVTLKIDGELAEKLRHAAETAGESFETFALQALEAASVPDDMDELAELERIAQETVDNNSGIPWEEVEPWVRGWGKPDGPPRPR